MFSEELAHQGSAARPVVSHSSSCQDIKASNVQSEPIRRSQQTSGLRQRKQLRLSSLQYAVLLAALLLICQSEAFSLEDDEDYDEPEDESILMRVTEAVQDAAQAVGPAANRLKGQIKRTLHLKETQVRCSIRPYVSSRPHLAALYTLGLATQILSNSAVQQNIFLNQQCKTLIPS